MQLCARERRCQVSDCTEPCDGCANRATHHLCDKCCEEDTTRLSAEVGEVERLREEGDRLRLALDQMHNNARIAVAELNRQAEQIANLKARLRFVKKAVAYDIDHYTQTVYNTDTDAALDLRRSWKKGGAK